jgi:SpoVK/Ycf46/Vps4 family AAA+-type ATPase
VIICATTGSVQLDGARPVLALPATPVAADQRRLAWRAMLPGLDEATAADLTARLPLDPAWIATVAGDVQIAGQDPTLPSASAALRRRTGAVLPLGVELTTPDVPWTRLVLPEEASLQLRDAVARITHQGTVLDDWRMGRTARAHRGTRLLLTGLPGTGKSLAAEVLATAAHTDLMRVDLSQIVSKWLGETEKHLAATFDAAERIQAVLLLDEADALFGNRTEISDAHDRYANLETAYLLQRLDTFDGLLVLTTNLRHNIDAAFLRRMDFVVEVPLPDLAGRRELWALHLPAGHVAADVDLDVLARMYPVPGGWIRNAALAAAFAAAAGHEACIHQHHLIATVRREYAKAALPFPGEPPRRRDEH